MKHSLTRRELLAQAVAGAAAGSLAAETSEAPEPRPLPRRPLGKTGVTVPILGFGTAPAGIRRSLTLGAGLYHEALDLGVNYFDTAPSHTGYGRAQAQLGQVLRTRRKEAFVATKCHAARGDDALRLLERNLKELKTDHADLVYVHSLGDLDLRTVVSRGGVLHALMKAKREGLARFIGVTGHHRPQKFLRVLQDFDLDVIMCAVNFADRHTYGFEEKVWPVAARKDVALVAMKVFGGMVYTDKGMSNCKMPREYHGSAFRYALSVPNVSLAVIGMATKEELHQNLARARQFKPLTPAERQALSAPGRRLAARWGAHLGAVV